MVGFFRLPPKLDIALGARGLAALAVVWWHVHGYGESSLWLQFLTPSGRSAVWLFFSLSGYMMAQGFVCGRYRFEPGSLIDYLTKRFLRVWPLFLLVSVFSFALARAQGTAPAVDGAFVFREVFMLQLIHAYSLNGVFWTLGVEVQFYVLLPVVMFCLLRSRQPALWGAVFYLALVTLTAAPLRDRIFPWMTSDSRDLLGNLSHFQAGILVALVSKRVAVRSGEFQSHRLRMVILAVLLTGIALIAAFDNALYFRNPEIFFSWKGGLLVDAFSILVLVLHVTLEAWRVELRWWSRILSILGVLSYGLYCWHGALGPVQFLRGQFLILLASALGLSVLTYRTLERPLMELRSRLAIAR